MKLSTNSLETDEIKSIADLLKILYPHEGVLPQHYIFRGQENWEWNLIPSLFRLKDFSNGTFNWEGVEMAILQEFYREADPFLNNFIDNPLRRRMLAQHYGAPTRLLDWTTNPLVALYFATINLENQIDGSFYIANVGTSLTGGIDVASESNLNDYEFYKLIPTRFDERILAQSAIFTTHALPPNLNEFIGYEQRQNEKSTPFYKLRIKSENKVRIRFELEMFGINHARLFPGLDGIGSNIKWIFKRHQHWTKIISHWNSD